MFWKHFWNVLSTNENLMEKGCNLPSKCDLCGINFDASYHVFLIAYLLYIYVIDLVLFCKCKLPMILIASLIHIIVAGSTMYRGYACRHH